MFTLRKNNTVNMSSKQPVIKFSPFEALLIGEKNKVLKQEPMKNTIFVTKLNERNRSINLRDLFGLEKDHKYSEGKNVVFKIPQRVHDFWKNKKIESKSRVAIVQKNRKVLCYKCEKQKRANKNHKDLKDKKVKLKSNKVKFKKKVKQKDILNQNSCKTFCNSSKKIKCNRTKNSSVISRVMLQSVKKIRYNNNRHSLRGKDGKFICKSEYEKLILKSKKISSKQKYLTNYLHKLYLNKNKHFFSNDKSNKSENSNGFQMCYTIENIVGIPKIHKQFDLSVSETMLNEISSKYYENYCYEDFQFPKFPKEVKFSDFEDDCNLMDIIYESLPRFFKFESRNSFADFSETLRNSEIFSFEKNLKIYEKKKNQLVSEQRVSSLLQNHISSYDEEKPNISFRNIRNGLTETIDEPYTKKSHLISGKSLASLFYRNVEGKDIFIGNLVKPFLQNSWFGRLPEL